MELTTWQAHKKYRLSSSQLRRLLAKKVIKGREVPVSSKRHIWLIDESSLKKYLKTPRKPGPKSSK